MSKLIRSRVATGKLLPGSVARVDDAYADLLISGGFATEVETLADRVATERPLRQVDPEVPELVISPADPAFNQGQPVGSFAIDAPPKPPAPKPRKPRRA